MKLRELFKHLSDEEYEKLIASMCVTPHDCFQRIKTPKASTPEEKEYQKAAI